MWVILALKYFSGLSRYTVCTQFKTCFIPFHINSTHLPSLPVSLPPVFSVCGISTSAIYNCVHLSQAKMLNIVYIRNCNNVRLRHFALWLKFQRKKSLYIIFLKRHYWQVIVSLSLLCLIYRGVKPKKKLKEEERTPQT